MHDVFFKAECGFGVGHNVSTCSTIYNILNRNTHASVHLCTVVFAILQSCAVFLDLFCCSLPPTVEAHGVSLPRYLLATDWLGNILLSAVEQPIGGVLPV